MTTSSSLSPKKTWADDSPTSYDSIVDEEAPAIEIANSKPSTTLTSSEGVYDAAAIRAEFRLYHSILPKPDKLLQQQHSVEILRGMIERSSSNDGTVKMPRFLKSTESEGGIKPHNALCALLLDDFERLADKKPTTSIEVFVSSWLVWALSFGRLYRQLHVPAEFIRDQFYRVAHAIPTEQVHPHVLREKIRSKGLPIPNFFLDPEDDKQFPPHIAMLVILQDGEKESQHLKNRLTRLAWLSFAFVALLLRLVLEVIGGAGAIWGGSEVFHLRDSTSNELWRYISIGVGVFCFLRFVTLNAPQAEDEGDILGPAGPWSLRTAARLRAVCEHPFHYFARAQAPYSPKTRSHKHQS